MKPGNFRPMPASRELVMVVLRERMSISPDCNAVKRSLAFNWLNLTLVASPKTAAATARQTSASIPRILPLASGTEKPGRPSLTPHCTKPFFCTASRVAPAWAKPLTPNTAAAHTMARVDFNTFIQTSSFALVVSELEPQRTLMRRYRPVLAFFRVKRHEVVAVIPVAIPQAAVTDSVTVVS